MSATAPAAPFPPTDRLAQMADWLIFALHNGGIGAPLAPAGWFWEAPSPREFGDYAALYAALVESPLGAAPPWTPLLQTWVAGPPGAVIPAPRGSADAQRFLALFGGASTARRDQHRACREVWAGAVAEARVMLGLQSEAPAPGAAPSPAPATAPAPPAPARGPTPSPPTSSAPAAIPPSVPAAPPLLPPRALDRTSVAIRARPLQFTPVAQVQGLLVAPRQSGADVFAAAMARVITWLRGKHVAVPDDWAAIPSWEAGTDGAARQVWYESAGGQVAIRFDEPCGEVAGRQWRVEVTLLEEERRVLVGVKLSAMVQQGVDTTIRPSVPGLVRALADGLTLVVDGQALGVRPVHVGDAAGVARLVQLIGARRSCAVVVCVTASPRCKEATMAARLAHRVAGTAHVATLSAHLVPAFEAQLGAGGRLPPAGVRLFGRVFDPALAAVHCPTLAEGWWPSAAGVEVLSQACVAETVSVPDPDDLPSFAHIRQWVVRRRRQEDRRRRDDDSRKVEDRLREALAERDAIEGDLQAAEQLVDELQRQVDHYAEESRTKDARLWVLEQRVLTLEARAAPGEAPAIDVAALATWDAVFAWADTTVADRLVLTDKARRAARNSVFDDIGFAAEVLAMLAGPYRDMRAGDDAARNAYLAQAQQLRVEVSGVGTALNQSRLAGQYRATWKGRTYDLDLHVSGSSSRHRQRGFRVYFAWDDERQMIVVGSLPEHLTNTHS